MPPITPKSLNAAYGIKYSDTIDLMHQSGFTKFAKPMVSAVNNPDDYGVEFTRAAKKAITVKLNIPQRKHYPRDRSCKVQAYVTKQLAHDFTAARMARHQTPTQALTEAIGAYIKNAVPSSSTTGDGEETTSTKIGSHRIIEPEKENCQDV